MNPPIVSSDDPIALVGGGEIGPYDFSLTRVFVSQWVAADGGVSKLLTDGRTPAAVIGDFDSLSADDQLQIPQDRLHHITEQNSTDFDKALRNISAPVVIGLGFSGGRMDHQLAALHTLARRCAQPCVLLNAYEVVCLLPPKLSLPTKPGETVSLMPLAPMQGRSTGLRWEIDGLAFDPLMQIGTSNEATGPLTLEMEAPHMIGMFPRSHLGALTQSLAALGPHGRWPAL